MTLFSYNTVMGIIDKKRFLTEDDLLGIGDGQVNLSNYYKKTDFVNGLGIVFTYQDGKIIVNVNPSNIPSGKSAYELWLDAGNVGTLQDYQDSLKGETGQQGATGATGKSAYQYWLEQPGNADKSVADFLNSLQGIDGQNGLSAYEVWKNTGNPDGTQEQFLASLKGEDGQNGENGLSAYEIWKNSGNPTGTVTQFLASLKGETGNAGTAATIAVGGVTTLVAGSNATVVNAGTSAAAIFNFGIPRGATGETGQTGQQGPAGQTGQTGQNGIDGKSAYQLWLDRGNTGTEQNFLDSLKGEDGEDGDDGVQATVMVGSVTTLAAETDATVVNAGTNIAAVLKGTNGTFWVKICLKSLKSEFF